MLAQCWEVIDLLRMNYSFLFKEYLQKLIHLQNSNSHKSALLE